MNINKENSKLFTLYPKDNLTDEQIKPYKEKLDLALSDPKIKNLAITGPYDSGKSSLLQSYFKNREFKRGKIKTWIRKLTGKNLQEYEFINLPNFFENTENNANNTMENNIEQSIVKQLLFTENPFCFPYSRINRLKAYPIWRVLSIDLLLFFSILFQPVRNMTKKWDWQFYFIFGIFLVLISFWIAHIFSKISISAKIKAPVGESELDTNLDNTEKDKTDLFSYFEDELIYYFKHSLVRIVIFEDLDRFNSPQIFQKLHELNENLNQSSIRIKFIYTLKESVFYNTNVKRENSYENKAAENKSKFFDYVLPIFPLHSFQNSKNKWYKALNCCDFISKNNKELSLYPSKKLIHNLGNYIFDNREILTIVSELDIFAQKLPMDMFKNSNAIDKLLATIVYKNIYPNDFEDITIGKSKIDYLMKNITKFYNAVIYANNNEITAKINSLNTEITDINRQITLSIRNYLNTKYDQICGTYGFILNGTHYYSNTDMQTVNNFWKSYLDGDGSIEQRKRISDKFELEDNKKSQIASYLNGDLQTFDILKLTNTRDNLKIDLQKNESDINAKSLGQIIDLLNKSDDSFQEKVKQKFNASVIEYIMNTDILRFLLINDYLDTTFYDYISPDSFNSSLSAEEREFLRNVESRNPTLSNIKLVHKIKVLEELENLEVDYFYAYSTDVLYLLCEQNKRDTKIQSLLNHVKKQKDFEFLSTIIDDFNLDKAVAIKLLNNLFISWPELFLVLKDNSSAVGYGYQLNLVNFLVTTISYNSSLLNPKIYNFLAQNNIIASTVFKRYLNSDDKVKKLFKDNKTYKFNNLKFFKSNKSVISYLIKCQCYESNIENFKTIISFEGSLNSLIIHYKRDNIQEGFITSNIQRYINDHIGIDENSVLNFDDFIAYINWAKEHKLKDYKDFIFVTYLDANFDRKLSNSDKTNILENTNISDVLNNYENNRDRINKLIQDNKLPYKNNFWEILFKQNKDIAKKYFIKTENESVIDEWFKETRYWDCIMNYLSSTNYPKSFVKKIETFNYEWTEKDCDKTCLQKLINFSSNVKTIRKIMSYSALTNEMKDDILLLMLDKFKGKFTKSEVSEFYFDNAEYISEWPIGERKKIPCKKEFYAKIQRWIQVVKPLGLVSKNNNHIMLKKLNERFK